MSKSQETTTYEYYTSVPEAPYGSTVTRAVEDLFGSIERESPAATGTIALHELESPVGILAELSGLSMGEEDNSTKEPLIDDLSTEKHTIMVAELHAHPIEKEGNPAIAQGAALPELAAP